VITGIGAITPIGSGRDGLWQGVRRERSAVQRITRFDPSGFRAQVAAQVNDFEPLDYMDRKQARRLDRFSQFALAAARQAVADASLVMPNGASEETGIYIGSALGGVAFGEEQHQLFLAGGIRAVQPTLALAVFGGASSSNIAIEMGIRGPNLANANSCASGTIAIGEAFRVIRHGGAEIMLAGGVEAPLAPLTFGAFDVIKVLSTHNAEPEVASRPFDSQRDGFVMAEGAAVLVLEELGHALRRDAHIYGEVLGYGNTNDSFHMTAPLPSGDQAARAMRLALAEAELSPDDIDYVNAHASSTVLNDRTETLAIKKALGEHAYDIPVSGTKGMHGHALGATGAMETAICALIFEHDYLPSTVNLVEPDVDCDLDYIPHTGRSQRVDHILTNSFGFGGINAVLALGRYS
jgi:3-oxoacyl-[acyl-carrier-protein] synthase II